MMKAKGGRKWDSVYAQGERVTVKLLSTNDLQPRFTVGKSYSGEFTGKRGVYLIDDNGRCQILVLLEDCAYGEWEVVDPRHQVTGLVDNDKIWRAIEACSR